MIKFASLLLAMCPFACMAQDIIVTNDGDPIKGYNLDCSNEWVYYTQTPDDSLFNRIAIKDVLAIKKENGEKIVPSVSVQEQAHKVRTLRTDSLKSAVDDYKGFLLAKGNNVYVMHKSKEEYERAGQETLSRQIQKDQFWNVVNDPNLAHFILEYKMETKGSDKAMLIVNFWKEKNKQGKPLWDYIILDSSGADERLSKNSQIALEFHKRLKDLMQSIEKGKIPLSVRRASR